MENRCNYIIHSLLIFVPVLLLEFSGEVRKGVHALFMITMATGSMNLAIRGVLVTRLSAAEDAATMDTLCSDKTGTITMNKLPVAGIIPMNRLGETDVQMYGALASEKTNHDPIELAFAFAIRFYFGMPTVFVVREMGHFWNSFPSKSLFSIARLDMIVVAFLLTVGIPGLKPVPIIDTLTVIGMSVFFCFVVNDFIKYFMPKPKNEKL
jgi:hypothetical protein